MPEPALQSIADAVTRRAQRQGYVTPRDIRSELALAGLPEARWRDVLALAKSSFNYRQGRYYHAAAVSARLFEEQAQRRLIEKQIRKMIRAHRAALKQRERRGQTRTDFIQPVRVTTDDGKVWNLLSRDLSPTGIRLLGVKQLLGQKVHIELSLEHAEPLVVTARILWTCSVGDDLFENGGNFLAVEG